MNREEIKKAHEKAVIIAFLSHYNETHSAHYAIVETPKDLPDAIISDGTSKKRLWVEHCDVYRTPSEAEEDRDANGFHAHGGVYSESQIVNAFIKTLQNKLAKTSYLGVFNKLGPGILVMVLRDPLFNGDTLTELVDVMDEMRDSIETRGNFSKVYLTWNSTSVFLRVWPDINRSDYLTIINAFNSFREERDKEYMKLQKEFE